jgi:hypothetical protein
MCWLLGKITDIEMTVDYVCLQNDNWQNGKFTANERFVAEMSVVNIAVDKMTR